MQVVFVLLHVAAQQTRRARKVTAEAAGEPPALSDQTAVDFLNFFFRFPAPMSTKLTPEKGKKKKERIKSPNAKRHGCDTSVWMPLA